MTNGEYLALSIERYFGPNDALTAIVKEVLRERKNYAADLRSMQERYDRKLFEVKLDLSIAEKALRHERKRLREVAALHSTNHFYCEDLTCLSLEAEERLRSFTHTVAPPEGDWLRQKYYYDGPNDPRLDSDNYGENSEP